MGIGYLQREQRTVELATPVELGNGISHGIIGFRREPFVKVDQLENIFSEILRRSDSQQGAAGDVRADSCVAFEMVTTGGIDAAALGLADIVEQRGPSADGHRWARVDYASGVAEHVIDMERRILGAASHRIQLGNYGCEDVLAIENGLSGDAADEHPIEHGKHLERRYIGEVGGRGAHGQQDSGVDSLAAFGMLCDAFQDALGLSLELFLHIPGGGTYALRHLHESDCTTFPTAHTWAPADRGGRAATSRDNKNFTIEKKFLTGGDAVANISNCV